LCARAAAPHLREAKGAIVNIASTRAIMSEAGSEAYAASKGGLLALTHALAASLQPDVRVNCVSPGWIETRASGTFEHSSEDKAQHLVGRVGTPEDIAGMVAFLASSSQAGFMTGQNVVVDGGMTKKMIYLE
jgi:NAD(P)-dependent dehydrogenase (short-subunit alcohol dehydrogenase family)